MAGYVQTNQPITLTLTGAAVTISPTDTGKLFLIGAQAQATTATLPALQPGLHYRFQTTVASAQLAFNFLVSAGATIIEGVIANVVDGLSAVTDRTSIAFSATAVHGSIGDAIELYCDGVHWSVFAYGRLTGSFILA